MAAIIAIIAFVVALIFHIAGGSVLRYYVDAELTGFIFLTLHLVWGYYPWRSGVARRTGPPA